MGWKLIFDIKLLLFLTITTMIGTRITFDGYVNGMGIHMGECGRGYV